jgi:hypothetical protein
VWVCFISYGHWTSRVLPVSFNHMMCLSFVLALARARALLLNTVRLLWQNPETNPLAVFSESTFEAYGISMSDFDMTDFYSAIALWHRIGNVTGIISMIVLGAAFLGRTVCSCVIVSAAKVLIATVDVCV